MNGLKSWNFWLVLTLGTFLVLEVSHSSGLDFGKVPWFISRSAGITAYVLLAAATIWGLLTSSRLLIRWVKPPVTLELHRFLTFMGLGMAGLHGVALLFDQQFSFHIWDLLVPFVGPYRPLAVGLGAIGAYLAVLLTGSFYIRQHIGPKVWRMFHYSGFLAFVLITAHGLFAGSDRDSLWMQLTYLYASGAVLLLTYIRIFIGRYSPARSTAQTPSAQLQ